MVKILLTATGEIKTVEISEVFKLLRQGVELELIEGIDVSIDDLKEALEEAIPTLDEIDGIPSLDEIDGVPSLDEIDGVPSLDEIDGIPSLKDLLTDE